jgi:hypothetical protein
VEPVIKKNIGGTVSTYHFSNEVAATASQLSNVTGIVYGPTGSELVSEGALSPEADGRMSVSISAGAAVNSIEWCRAHFQYDFDGATHTKDVYFHIAQTEFDVPVHYAELVKFCPNMADYAWSTDPKFAQQRDLALREIYSRLVNAGRQPWRIINTSTLNIAFAVLWLHYIFMTLSRNPEDGFRKRADAYRIRYEEEFAAANLLESETESPDVGDDQAKPISRTRLKRG